jgi:3-polyprenyl-4-hydroxybenzoate decarboxylase
MKTNADFTLRSYLADAEAADPARVWRIKDRVNLDHDMTALAMELEATGRAPILVFENVGNSPFPVASTIRWVSGSRRSGSSATGASSARAGSRR